jgi:hypothetical protein
VPFRILPLTSVTAASDKKAFDADAESGQKAAGQFISLPEALLKYQVAGLIPAMNFDAPIFRIHDPSIHLPRARHTGCA